MIAIVIAIATLAAMLAAGAVVALPCFGVCGLLVVGGDLYVRKHKHGRHR